MTKLHTPLPWKNLGSAIFGTGQYCDQYVAECKTVDDVHTIMNAQFIVTACNYHERLVEALEMIDRTLSDKTKINNYEGIWVNHPDKPEQTPASIVRALLKEIKGE